MTRQGKRVYSKATSMQVVVAGIATDPQDITISLQVSICTLNSLGGEPNFTFVK
jgi:hypothetical protein